MHSNMCIYSLSLSTAISQSPDNCIETIDTNINNLLYLVPSGTLCVDIVIFLYTPLVNTTCCADK